MGTNGQREIRDVGALASAKLALRFERARRARVEIAAHEAGLARAREDLKQAEAEASELVAAIAETVLEDGEKLLGVDVVSSTCEVATLTGEGV